VADRFNTTLISFKGGFATDQAPQVRQQTFLTTAENVNYEASNSIRKFGGTAKVNSTVLSGTPTITGSFDLWLAGAAGTFTHQHVVTTNDGKIYKEDEDGVMDDITGAAVITANAVPVFCQARDTLLIFTDKNDTPLKYTGTGNVASLGGTPPAGRGAVFHHNRVWIFSANATPSRWTYGSSTSIEDYTGADTGTVDVDIEDGDRIVGGAAYKNNLITFKGPNKGSIHIIGGRTPATFTRDVATRGIALQTHNSIISVFDDLWFMSNRGCHSFAATQKFGDYEGADLTRSLKEYFRTGINRSRLDKIWGVNYQHKGCVLWGLTPSGASKNTQAFGISFVNQESEGARPFVINRECSSIAVRTHPTTKINELVFGASDGFLRRQDLQDRTIDGGAGYSFRVLTPSIVLGEVDSQGKPQGDQPVQLHRIWLRSRPTGEYNVTINVYRDGYAPEAYTFGQGTQGFILGTSVLGTGRLGGGTLQTVVRKCQGRARSVRLELTTTANSFDAELYEVGIDWTPIAPSLAANIQESSDTAGA